MMIFLIKQQQYIIFKQLLPTNKQMKKKSTVRKCNQCLKNLSNSKLQKIPSCCGCCHLNRSVTYQSVKTYRKKNNINTSSNNSSMFCPKTNNSKMQINELNSSSGNIKDRSPEEMRLKKLINQNLYLSIQNNQLKQHLESSASIINTKLQSSHHGLSILYNNPLQNTNNQMILQQKLYQSNKSLQQVILNLNKQEKNNSILQQKVSQLTIKVDQYKIQIQVLNDQIEKYRNKLKKYMPRIKKLNQDQRHIQKLKTTIQYTTQQNFKNEEKYQMLMKMNSQLQFKNEQLQKELNYIVNNQNLCKIQNVWVKKAAKKIDSIQENITKIQENQSQINNLRKEIQQIENQNNQKYNLIIQCEQYIQNQLNQCINRDENSIYESMQQSERTKKPTNFFKQLVNISNMFTDYHFKQVIKKLDISKQLKSLLLNTLNANNNIIEEIFNKIQQKFIKFESKYKGIEKKLINISKIIKNNRIKYKTQRTRMRHLSIKSNLQNKQNMNVSNIDNFKTIFVKKQFKKAEDFEQYY